MKASNRVYSMQDAELNVFASKLVNNITRDASEFALRGVNSAAITAFSNLQSSFELIPTDSYYSADISIASDLKNTHRIDAEKAIRSIVNCARIKWGEGSAQSKKFGAATMTRDNDKVFLTTCRQVITTATEYLATLASVGLTQDMIDDLEDLTNDFADDLNNILSAQEIRDIKTQERISKGNQLYEYVTQYCEIGKYIWIDVDEARYNDYIIYSGSNPGYLAAPQNFIFNPSNYTFTWSAVENAISYKIQQSNDGNNWTEYWSGSETSCIYEESPDTTIYFRVLAHNSSGNGPYSSIIQYNFGPTLIAPTNFIYIPSSTTFSWSVVPNTIYYEFQYRDISNPVWSSLNAGNSTVFYHADPNGNYISRVRAVNGPNMGPWSNTLEYSVGPIQPD